MNKKIKLSIISTLLLTSTLMITMPIVNCSSSNSNILFVNKSDIKFAAIGDAIAAVGKAGANSSSALTRDEYNNALQASYTGAVKTAIDEYLTFTVGSTIVPDPIQSITILGNYPNSSNIDLNVQIIVKLKPNYTATSEADLTINNVQIGKSTITIIPTTLRVLKHAPALIPLGTALAKIGNPSATTNTGGITRAQHASILATTYASDGINFAINNFYVFTLLTGTRVYNAIESIKVTGDYPPSGDVNVTITIKLWSQYVARNPADLLQIVKVGVYAA